jgi:1-acyl-sn-glycerol-3-phosphate acyltransferase
VTALPRLDDVPPPRTAALTRYRPAAQRLLRRWYDVRTHREHLVPAEGPVIVAPNHIGWWDGPLVAIFGPRPVHALTKREMFSGPLGPFLRWSGQIELDRFHADPAAVKTFLRVLADGGAAGIFPEGTRGAGELTDLNRGAAYFALVSGAPVVPLTFFGTREPGADSHSRPPRGARFDLVFGEPWRVARRPWPRRADLVAERTRDLGDHLRRALADARQLLGRELPGPLPAGDSENAAARKQDVV